MLASGEATLSDLGDDVDPAGVMPLMLPLSNVEAGVLSGQAWWIDRFGNAQINFGPEDLALLGIDPGSDVKVTVGTRLSEGTVVALSAMV